MATHLSDSTGFPKDAAKRSILAHMEHLKSIGEAFSKAAGAYKIEHDRSEEDLDRENAWLEDLPKNISEAVKAFHKSLSESPKKVFDTLFSETEQDEPSGSGSAGESGEENISEADGEKG